MFLQDKPNGQIEECCSYTSSNRESWGRCSSLGGSDEEESSADCAAADNCHQVSLSLSCMCWHVFSLTKLLIFLIYHFMSHRLEAFPAQFIWVVGQRTDVLPDVMLWTG